MKHWRYAIIVTLAVGVVTLPWACSNGFGVTPTSPSLSATPTVAATATQSPVVTSTPSPAPTLTDIDMGAGVTVIPGGLYQVGCVHLGSGATVSIQGAVTIFCTCFTMDAGATITGSGAGSEACPACPRFPNGTVSSAECGRDEGNGYTGAMCSGGGHGGAGAGFYVYSYSSGVTYWTSGGQAGDDPVHPTEVGGSGGWPLDASYGQCEPGSNGGGLLWIIVYDPVQNRLGDAVINGTIDMGGWDGGPNYPSGENSGGGAGGTILIESAILSGSGLLTADGGGASMTGAAGGGGGIISLIADASSFSGQTSAAGGSASNGGFNIPAAQDGIVTVTAPPAQGY